MTGPDVDIAALEEELERAQTPGEQASATHPALDADLEAVRALVEDTAAELSETKRFEDLRKTQASIGYNMRGAARRRRRTRQIHPPRRRRRRHGDGAKRWHEHLFARCKDAMTADRSPTTAEHRAIGSRFMAGIAVLVTAKVDGVRRPDWPETDDGREPASTSASRGLIAACSPRWRDEPRTRRCSIAARISAKLDSSDGFRRQRSDRGAASRTHERWISRRTSHRRWA